MITNDKEQFQVEQNELLQFILDQRFFNPWREAGRLGYIDKFSAAKDCTLELYLTSSCNQNCEYCYLTKYPDLYPSEYNKKDLIFNNLDILYNWLIEENMYIPVLEVFTGEIWQSSFGLDFFQHTWDAIQRGLRTNGISIPSNCSFLNDWEQTCKIQRWINKFRQYGIDVTFSISVDGKIIDEVNRPRVDKTEYTDEFYDRMFMFATHNGYGYHPMVAAVTVDKWIENHKWWEQEFNKRHENVDDKLMMLEVRNSDWTEERIQAYNEFMKYLINRQVQRHGSVEHFAQGLFGIVPAFNSGYVPYAPAPLDTFAGCTVCNSLTVRLGDLAIAPCHRQAYNKFLYGHFIVNEDNQIAGITANNPHHAIRILMANNNLCHLGCDVCPIAEYCLKGCYGSQYEETNDPFIPSANVCHFFKEKWKNLMYYYKEIGVLDALAKISPYNEHYEEIQKFLQFYERIK